MQDRFRSVELDLVPPLFNFLSELRFYDYIFSIDALLRSNGVDRFD